MKEAQINLLNRIKYFLIDNPQSTAATIAHHMGVSRQAVTQTISTDKTSAFLREVDEGVAKFSINTAGAIDNLFVPPPRNLLAEAISALIDPLTAQIRLQLDADLARIIQSEVDTAIAQVQERVKSRLADVLLAKPEAAEPVKFDGFGQSVGAPTRAKEQADYNEKARLALIAMAPIQSLPVGLPPGNFVPQDVVSKRTSHKPVGKGVVVEAAPLPEEAPSRPPKLTIVGLRTNMQGSIKREYSTAFDLRLYSPDQLSTIKQVVKSGDDVIVLTDYISHKHTDVVDAAGAVVTTVHGGMHILRDELNARITTITKAA